MSSKRWSVKPSDVRRAIKAVTDMRLPVSGVRIDLEARSIYIDTTPPTAPSPVVEDGRPNSFDQVLGGAS